MTLLFRCTTSEFSRTSETPHFAALSRPSQTTGQPDARVSEIVLLVSIPRVFLEQHSAQVGKPKTGGDPALSITPAALLSQPH